MTGAERYEVTIDRSRVDIDQVIAFLAEEVPWGRWRSRAQLRQAIDNSWRLGAAIDRQTGEVVTFMRAISDGVSHAYLADVFTKPDHQGQGLALRVLQEVIEQDPGRWFCWMLHTDSAHGLYARMGFHEPGGTFMERVLDPGAAADRRPEVDR